MTPDQLSAYTCLADNDKLSDPQYAYNKQAAEARLKARCKACWHLRQHFPQWIVAYIKKWEAQKLRGNKRTPGEGTEQRAVQDVVTG